MYTHTTHTHTHTCTHIQHTCTHIQHTHNTNTHIQTHVHTYNTHTHTCTHIQHTHTCTHIQHTHTCTHIQHTHTCTHIQHTQYTQPTWIVHQLQFCFCVRVYVPPVSLHCVGVSLRFHHRLPSMERSGKPRTWPGDHQPPSPKMKMVRQLTPSPKPRPFLPHAPHHTSILLVPLSPPPILLPVPRILR